MLALKTRQRAAHAGHRRAADELALPKARPARPDQGLPRARRPAAGPHAARRSPSRSRSSPSARPHPRRLVNLEHHHGRRRGRGHAHPRAVEVSIEGLEAGTQIPAKDIALPAGTTLDADEDSWSSTSPLAPTAEELEAEGAEEVEEAAEAVPEAASRRPPKRPPGRRVRARRRETRARS